MGRWGFPWTWGDGDFLELGRWRFPWSWGDGDFLGAREMYNSLELGRWRFPWAWGEWRKFVAYALVL